MADVGNEPRDGVTIVIATFNAEASLPRTLESIATQRNVDWDDVEVILADGNSSDKTLDLAVASGLFASIRSSPDKGVYDAMNLGARMGERRWLHFLNAGDAFMDDKCLAEVLESLRSARENGQIWVISGARNRQGGGLIPNLPHRWARHVLGLQPHCHQACWFDRTMFMAMSGYSLEFGTAGDFDLIMRYGLISRPANVERALIDYEGGGMSAIGPWKTASLLSAVRISRFQINGMLGLFDGLVTFLTACTNALRTRLGAIRNVLSRSRSMKDG